MRKIILAAMLVIATAAWAQDDPFKGKVFYQCASFGFEDGQGLSARFIARITFQDNGLFRSEEISRLDDPQMSAYDVTGYSIDSNLGQLFLTKNKERFLVLQIAPGIFGLYPAVDPSMNKKFFSTLEPESFLVQKGSKVFLKLHRPGAGD